MFDRKLPGPFLLAREQLEPELASAGFQLETDNYYCGAFGSASSEYRGPIRNLRIDWDGKEMWLSISVSRIGKKRPTYKDWTDLEHETGIEWQDPYLIDDHNATRRVNELRVKLRTFIASGAATGVRRQDKPL